MSIPFNPTTLQLTFMFFQKTRVSMIHQPPNNHYLKLIALTFISSIFASLFLVVLILHQRNIEYQKMNVGNFIEKEKILIKKKVEINNNNIFLNVPPLPSLEKEEDYKKKIKHIQKSEINEDHCVLYNFVKSNNNNNFTMRSKKTYEPISLALHSTINYAYYIVQQAQTWSDLISYSIYLLPGNEPLLFLLKQLHECHSEVNSKISIHLVWNRGFFQMNCINEELIKNLREIDSMIIDCSDFSLAKLTVELKSLQIPMANYPINIMRNEARRGASTKIHLISDIETRFSNNFAKNVRNLTQNLLHKKFGKSVLVFRRFEINSGIPFPENVRELRKLFKEKVFEFHWHFFKAGHSIPKLKQWLDYSVSNEKIKYEIQPYFREEWEPQFIMLAQDPYHLEFVPTRFNDHQTLCHQLCREGYDFLIMSHVFNIHPGIKRSMSPIELATSKLGRKRASGFIRKFNNFLDKNYPKSNNNNTSVTKKCPKMTH